MLRFKTSGNKRRFGAAGVTNILATNILLQALLASHGTTIATATFISQAFNGIFGYLVYGKWVFKSKTITGWLQPLAYGCLMALMWGLNTAGIRALASLPLAPSRSTCALIMIVPLAMISYAVQKYLIFKPCPSRP